MNLPFSSIPSIDRDRQNRSWRKKILFFLIFLSLVLRLAYLWEIQSNPLPKYTSQSDVFDQYNFVNLAEDILAHSWLGSKTIIQSPAYSYIIAFIFRYYGRNINYVFLFQIFLGVLSIYIFYMATSLLFENKTVGLIAALIATFYSPFIYYECTVLRASTITYTNLLAFYFFLKAIRKNKIKYFFLSGIAIGVSAILRPNVLGLLALYPFAAINRSFRYKLTYALILILGISLSIAPLAIRNRAIGANILISSTAAGTFWCGNAYDSKGIGTTRTPYHKKLAEDTDQGKIIKTIQVLWREIRKYPEEYRNLYGRKFKMLLNGYEVPANLSYDLFKRDSAVLKISFFNFVIVCPLALLGLILAYGKFRHINLLYAFFFILSFFVFVFHIQSRYRIPFIPFYIIFASYTLYWFYYTLRTKNFKAIRFAFFSLAVISLFTKPDYKIIKKYLGSPIRDIDYSNLTNAYIEKYISEHHRLSDHQKNDLLVKALENRKDALRISPIRRRADYLYSIGMLHTELKQYDEALDSLRHALAYSPNDRKIINLIYSIENKLKNPE